MSNYIERLSLTNPREWDSRIEFQEKYMQIVPLVSFCSRWPGVLYLDGTVQTWC